MYVTLYAADNRQIVLDTIKDTENAKLLFTTHYDILEGNQINVTSEVMTDVPEPVAEDLLGVIEYVHNFYPDSEQAKTELPGCGALVASVEPTPLHRDDYGEIVGMFQFETESGDLNMSVPSMDHANITHMLIDHMYKSVKAYIDDPRPMSEATWRRDRKGIGESEMSKHKNDVKEFGAREVAKCFVFMAVGLFVAGAGFGGCVVCSVARGCSWTISLPSLVVMLVGAVTFMLSTFNLVEGLESEGDM